jgi:hypothetical protein
MVLILTIQRIVNVKLTMTKKLLIFFKLTIFRHTFMKKS